MEKIDKSRKWVVYSGWTDDEKLIFQEAINKGLTPIIWDWEDERSVAVSRWRKCPREKISCWQRCEKIKDKGIDSTKAYWIAEWDEPTGEELVGKWCLVSDIPVPPDDLDSYPICKVIGYDPTLSHPYQTAREWFKYAVLLRKDKMEVLFRENEDKETK